MRCLRRPWPLRRPWCPTGPTRPLWRLVRRAPHRQDQVAKPPSCANAQTTPGENLQASDRRRKGLRRCRQSHRQPCAPRQERSSVRKGREGVTLRASEVVRVQTRPLRIPATSALICGLGRSEYDIGVGGSLRILQAVTPTAFSGSKVRPRPQQLSSRCSRRLVRLRLCQTDTL